MTLAELKESAPRTFDKDLLDLIAAVQSGGQPIRDAGLSPEVGGALLSIIERVQATETALAQAAEAITSQAMQVVELMRRLETIEAANRMLAAEAAKRIGAAA